MVSVFYLQIILYKSCKLIQIILYKSYQSMYQFLNKNKNENVFIIHLYY